jgi:DNA mismatch repair ATPase MutS
LSQNEGVNELELLREQVKGHQRILEEHTDILKQHAESFEDVMRKQKEHDDQIKEINANYLKLENVIYSENKETRNTMQVTTDRLFHLIEQMTGQKQASTALEYDFKKAALEVSDKKSQRLWEWFGKAAGAGGVIALVVAALLQLLGQ